MNCKKTYIKFSICQLTQMLLSDVNHSKYIICNKKECKLMSNARNLMSIALFISKGLPLIEEAEPPLSKLLGNMPHDFNFLLNEEDYVNLEKYNTDLKEFSGYAVPQG